MLCSLKEMQKKSTGSAFTIKVGERKFSVLRSMLENCLDSFHVTVERFTNKHINGAIVLEGMKHNAIETCINFMYTEDESLITSDNVAEILNAATTLQFRKLKAVCFKCMLRDISCENCIPLFNLACIYEQEALEKTFGEYIRDHYESVVTSTVYQQLAVCDALFFAICFGSTNDRIWDAASSWIEYDVDIRGRLVLDFFWIMSLDEFPDDHLIERLWDAKYFRRSTLCKHRLFKCVFTNISLFSQRLSIVNWFALDSMADECDYVVQEIKDALCNFLLENFTHIVNHRKFVQVSPKDIVAIFQSPHAIYVASEKLKWDAMLTWMKGNPFADESTLFELLEAISLNSIPNTILCNAISYELLFKKYPFAQRILENAVKQAPIPLEENAIAILYDNDELDVLEVNERKWTATHLATTGKVKMTVLNGHLCLLDGASLQARLNRKWVHLSPMTKVPQVSANIIAFQDMIFVVEQKFYSCYNSMTNSWTEQLVLPWLGNADFYPVAGEEKIYLISSSPASLYKSSRSIFEEINIPSEESCEILPSSSAAYCSGGLYFLGKRKDSSAAESPVILRYKVVERSWTRVSFPRQAWFNLFVLENCLHALSTESHSNGFILLEYSEKWDEWAVIEKKAQPKPVGLLKKVERICSFQL